MVHDGSRKREGRSFELIEKVYLVLNEGGKSTNAAISSTNPQALFPPEIFGLMTIICSGGRPLTTASWVRKLEAHDLNGFASSTVHHFELCISLHNHEDEVQVCASGRAN